MNQIHIDKSVIYSRYIYRQKKPGLKYVLKMGRAFKSGYFDCL